VKDFLKKDLTSFIESLSRKRAREIAERAQKASLVFGDLLHSQVRVFNPTYKEAKGVLVGG